MVIRDEILNQVKGAEYMESMEFKQLFKRYQGEGEQRWINQLSEKVQEVLEYGGNYLSHFLNPYRLMSHLSSYQ